MISMNGDLVEPWGPRERDIDESRLMILRVGHYQMLRAVKGVECLENGLPEDASIISVHYDPQYRSFVSTLRSSSFKPVAEGVMIPVMEPWWQVTEKNAMVLPASQAEGAELK